MSERIAQDETLTVRPPTDAEIRAAALTVCDRSTDTTDARVLLEALGFTTYTGWHMLGRLGGGGRSRKQVVRRGWLDGGAA